MKRLFALMLSLVSASSLYANYNGNPAQPVLLQNQIFYGQPLPQAGCEWEPMKIKFGYERTQVNDRKLASHHPHHNRIDRFEMLSNQGVMTIGLWDRIEAYGKLGAASFTFTDRPHKHHRHHHSNAQCHYITNDGPIWGAGGRVVLVRHCNTVVGFDGNYQFTRPKVFSDGHHQGKHNSRAHLKYHEWQLGLGVAQQISYFTPYIAVNYSSVHASLKDIAKHATSGTHNNYRYRNRHSVGMAVGATITACETANLTFEARLIDETAYTVDLEVFF